MFPDECDIRYDDDLFSDRQGNVPAILALSPSTNPSQTSPTPLNPSPFGQSLLVPCKNEINTVARAWCCARSVPMVMFTFKA